MYSIPLAHLMWWKIEYSRCTTSKLQERRLRWSGSCWWWSSSSSSSSRGSSTETGLHCSLSSSSLSSSSCPLTFSKLFVSSLSSSCYNSFNTLLVSTFLSLTISGAESQLLLAIQIYILIALFYVPLKVSPRYLYIYFRYYAWFQKLQLQER